MEAPGFPSWLELGLPTVDELQSRLHELIPAQADPQRYARRKMAARTVFVMLYGFAVEGHETWIRPTAVTDMTNAQAAKTAPEVRRRWLKLVQSSHRLRSVKGRWYGENTREPIRDETIQQLIALGIVVERTGLATTSPRPRYSLASGFLGLCEPGLPAEELTARIEDWRARNLTQSVLARIALLRGGAAVDRVIVALPNGESRRLAPGPSSLLTKAVVESFARRFLTQPAVLLISESARKIGYRDDEILRAVGLQIQASSTLPDVVLLDLATDPPLLVFVECVITAGAVAEVRRRKLDGLAKAAGYRPSECAFVTAFQDRVGSPFKTASTALAWGTFVWFESEPDNLVYFRDGRQRTGVSLATLLRAPGA